MFSIKFAKSHHGQNTPGNGENRCKAFFGGLLLACLATFTWSAGWHTPASAEQHDLNNSWEYVSWDVPSVRFSRTVYTGSQDILVASRNAGSYLNNGHLWQSLDGGETWTERVSWVGRLRNLAFSPAHRDNWYSETTRDVTGYAVGGAEGYGITMYLGKTTDAGQTWQDLSSNFRNSLDQGSTVLYGLAVIGAEKAYVSCREHVYQTIDGGNSWQQMGAVSDLKPDPNVPLNDDLHFTTTAGAAEDEIPVYGFISSSDSLFYTLNGGLNWQRIDPPWNSEEYDLLQLRFVNNQYGLALLTTYTVDGDSRWSSGRALWQTLDGGNTWSQSTAWNQAEGATPTTLYTTDGTSIWLGGGDDHIWHSTDNGKNWIIEHSQEGYSRIWGFTPAPPSVGTDMVAWRSIGATGTSIGGYYYKTDQQPLYSPLVSCLFDALEQAFPDLASPAGQDDIVVTSDDGPLVFRYYPNTNSYLAAWQGTLAYAGPATGLEILFLGSLETWYPAAGCH